MQPQRLPESYDSQAPPIDWRPARVRGMVGGSGCHWELFGLAVTIFGLAFGTLQFGGGSLAYVPNAAISGIGVFITLVAALFHSLL